MNLLLLFVAVGVVSDTDPNSGNGVNSLEYLAFLGSFTYDRRPTAPLFFNLAVEVWTGDVVELGSGWKVAMDTRLLG